MTEKFDVRSEILSAVSATNDQIHRSFLLLMLGVLDRLDSVLADDASLRKQVLNGHEPNHHGDHDWIQERRKADCDKTCEWVKAKMAEEAEADKNKRGVVLKFFGGLASQIGTVAATALVTWMAFVVAGK